MEQLVGKGTRFLGVSNTSPKQLEDIIKVAKVKPKVVQIEIHPYLAQTEYVKLIQQKGMAVTAYAPLANTNSAYRIPAQKILSHPTVNGVATARSCTAAQVVLAWNMARGVVVIPKAAKVAHQKENYASTEKCKLTPEDSAKIDSISATTQFRMLGNACAGGNACWEGLAKGY
jgi:diketogulonate reductase-like aldo/keto reductase